MNELKEGQIEGVVVEALPNAMFRVQIGAGDGAKEEIAYLAGKMRKYRIRVLVGDKVALLPDEYGGKPRIVRRF